MDSEPVPTNTQGSWRALYTAMASRTSLPLLLIYTSVVTSLSSDHLENPSTSPFFAYADGSRPGPCNDTLFTRLWTDTSDGE